MAMQVKVNLLILVGFFLPVLIVVSTIIVVTLLVAVFVSRFDIRLFPLGFRILHHIFVVLHAVGNTLTKGGGYTWCIYYIAGTANFITTLLRAISRHVIGAHL